MFCSICRKEIKEILRYCPYCGVLLHSNDELSLGAAIEKINELSKTANKDNNYEQFRLALETERKYPDSGKLQVIIGSIYLNAIGTERDIDKAEQYFRLAIQNGELDACLELGLVLMEKQQKECIIWLEKAMQNGETYAILVLGQIYDDGKIVEENIDKAMFYYNYALQLGDKRALGFLGSMYYCGQLGEENREKAFSYLKESVEEFPEDSNSLYDLARCYANGIGTETDRQKAEFYFRKALGYEPNNPNYLWAFAYCLEKSNNTECIQWYDKALSNNAANSGLALFDIYTEGKLIEKDIYSALAYLDKAILTAQKQNDSEVMSLAYDKRELFFAKPDSLLKSPYLAPQLSERYPVIFGILKTKVLPRKFFVWLEISVRESHEIEISAIEKSLEDNYPYLCENEIELFFVSGGTDGSRPNPLEDDVDGINSLIGQYYFSNDCKHIYKYQYWISRLAKLAQKGDLEAQAVVIGNNRHYDHAVQEGRDGSGFSLYIPLKDTFKQYEENLMNLFHSGDKYAKLAIAKYMSYCTTVDKKEILQQAADLGLTDAWYELGKLYAVDYSVKHDFKIDNYNMSEEYILEMSCYKRGLECNNGKKIQLCKIELRNNGELPLQNKADIKKNCMQKNLKNNTEFEKCEEIQKFLNLAFKALEKGAYAVAEKYYNTVLAQEPGNWEATFFSTYITYINVVCDSSDLAISNMQALVNTVPQSIHYTVLELSSRTNYCNIITKYVSEFCLQITELQFMKFNELVAYRHSQNHWTPIGFMNNYAYPRIEKLAYMLYGLGDNMAFIFSYGEAIGASKFAWKTGNTIMEMTKNHGSLLKKIEKKNIIKRYKNKI